MIDTAYVHPYTDHMTPERIIAIRTHHGLTKSELARYLGTSYPTVHNWETGKHKPTPVYIRMLTNLENHIAAPTSKD